MGNASFLGRTLLIANWLVAAGWLWRVAAAIRGLSTIPNLLDEADDSVGSGKPQCCVIVPARNEEKAIEATLRSLLAIEGVAIEVVAVDDRSIDDTGNIMDRIAGQCASGLIVSRHLLRVVHVEHLPDGWMGKTHAMALAVPMTNTPWLLFTDGDVFFQKDSLRRALSFAERERADHLVLFPTLILRSKGERMMIGFLQSIAVWTSRPWRVSDPKSRRDFIGVGAFNMVRREVYASIGGYETLRMEVLEDLRLGYRIKHDGFAQRVAFGQDLIRIHWGEGALGIVNNLTKNAFAIFRFRITLLLVATAGLLLLCLLPFASFFLSASASISVRIAGLFVLASLFALYRYYQRFTGTSVFYALTFPVAACLFIFAIFKSLVLTLSRGGVIWRGTLYPLRELRKHCGPLW